MNRLVLGAFCALLMVGIGLFWWQGRAAVERGAPPPELAASTPGPDVLPSADVSSVRGPAPPEASELTREEQRFFRYDRDRDRRITRNEMLSIRTDAFRDLDTDGNNLLTFEEWAVATSDRFAGMDKDGNGWLNAAEFATSAPYHGQHRVAAAAQAGAASSPRAVLTSHSPKSALAREV